MNKFEEWIMPYITGMETALIWLAVIAFVITTIIGLIVRIVLAFFPIPKAFKKVIRTVVGLISLGIAVLIWWLFVYPLV